MPLTSSETDALAVLVKAAWERFLKERPYYVKIRDYRNGKRGIPKAPEDAEPRLREIAENAVDNVLPLAIDSLSTPLSVVGFRATGTDDNLDAWGYWQAAKMDARQVEVYRNANSYGRAYGFEDSDRFRIGSPLDSYAAYADDEDDFPAYGFVLTVDETGTMVALRMVFFDDSRRYKLKVAEISQDVYDSTGIEAFLSESVGINPLLEDDELHGYDHAPIFKFGDGGPEITTDIMRRQRAINSTVYNRDAAEEYGAFPQKAIIGWDGTEAQKAQAGVTKVMAFADGPEDVDVKSFAAAALQPFIESVKEKKLALAQAMQVSPALLVPEANMAADMIALANAPYDRKLQTKQRIFGEDIERWLRAKAKRNGLDVPEDAETVWDETEPRSYAAVIDGIVKLASVEDKLTKTMVEDIPGWTAQKVETFMSEVRKMRAVSTLAEALAGVGAPDMTDAGPAGAPDRGQPA
jgi:hypothetical protein